MTNGFPFRARGGNGKRNEVRGRLLFNLAKNERQHFTVKYDKKKKEYTLALKGDIKATMSKPHTKAFEHLVQTVRSSGTVQVGINETFQYKDNNNQILSGSTAADGGGSTIPSQLSMSGDVEVHLSRSSFSPSVPGMTGQPVSVARSLVAGHEILGHARQWLVLGMSTENMAIYVENQIRAGRGLPPRALNLGAP